MTKPSVKVEEIVTGKILEKMRSENRVPWSKPWNSIYYQNAITGRKYSGLNILMLALFGTDTHYLTYNQAKAAGGFVKEGSKSVQVTFWNIIDKDKKTGKALDRKMFFLRYYNVFALKDIGGVEIARKGVNRIEFNPIAKAEEIAKACGVPISHGGDRACYSPATHSIRLPLPESFKSVEAYYCTLFHELTHAMGKDCGEKLDVSFGSEPYAKEELVAEIGANFLLTYCGIDSANLFDNSTAYLQNWMSAIANEPKLIVSAAGKAQKRFNAILSKLGVTLDGDAVEAEESAELVAA